MKVGRRIWPQYPNTLLTFTDEFKGTTQVINDQLDCIKSDNVPRERFTTYNADNIVRQKKLGCTEANAQQDCVIDRSINTSELFNGSDSFFRMATM